MKVFKAVNEQDGNISVPLDADNREMAATEALDKLGYRLVEEEYPEAVLDYPEFRDLVNNLTEADLLRELGRIGPDWLNRRSLDKYDVYLDGTDVRQEDLDFKTTGLSFSEAVRAAVLVHAIEEGAPDPLPSVQRTVVVIYVSGGVVQSVESTDPTVEIILHDQDNIDGGDEAPKIPENLKLVAVF